MRRTGRWIPRAALCAAALFALPAGADPGFQFSASVGLGEFTAGTGPPRFAVVPAGSFLLLLRESWLLRFDDAMTLLGTTGGRFGAANATTLSFGARWEAGNVSAGFSLAEYSLHVCGAHWCGQMSGIAPGLDARLDIFRPDILRGALGLSATCGALWFVGSAWPVWSGFSTRCALGPIYRLSSR